MTVGMSTGDGLRCRQCGHQVGPGERYCEQCGSALEVREVLPTPAQPAPDLRQPQAGYGPGGAVPTGPDADGTTRYLCAAAHLDEEFCEEAIAEFLVEPVRAIPPSPGVDSAVVLREVVAAQTRRRIRDGLILALLLVFALVGIPVVFLWAVLVGIAVGLVALVPNRHLLMAALRGSGARGDLRTVGRRTSGVGRKRRTLVSLVIALFVVVGAPFFFATFLLSSVAGGVLGDILPGFGLPTFSWSTLLIGALLLAVLAVDELTVSTLMNSSFRRGNFNPDPRRASSEWERLARSLGYNSYRFMLDRIAHANANSQLPGQADVIVYRGYTPFIGAGRQVGRQAIALPLAPAEDESDEVPDPIDVNELHRYVTEGLLALRSTSSLSPGRRLEQLQHREQVMMPADRLLFNRFQIEPPVLPDPNHPPLPQLPLGTARGIAESPLEWARYYSCFRVESWDRDLTTSCYLHIGTDQRMLYLEWTYCTLFPVKEKYRIVDHSSESRWTSFGHSLVDWVLLPASVAQRLRSVFRRHTALVQRPGEVVPARYGAARSLRELAAETETQSYFQYADTERYVRVMDRALFRAVGRYLEERGYSVVEFMRVADRIVNNYNGTFVGSALGKGSKVGDVRDVNVDTPPSGGVGGAGGAGGVK